MWGILGFAATAFSLAIDGIKWLRGRRRTRSKPQRVELSSRDELARAIGEVASTAITLLVRTREWNCMRQETPHHLEAETIQALEEADVSHAAAKEKLRQEHLVAASDFDQPIHDFKVCIVEQLDARSELRPDDLSGIGDINLKAKETVRRIDDIVSGQETP